jgi:hypothetical protein
LHPAGAASWAGRAPCPRARRACESRQPLGGQVENLKYRRNPCLTDSLARLVIITIGTFPLESGNLPLFIRSRTRISATHHPPPQHSQSPFGDWRTGEAETGCGQWRWLLETDAFLGPQTNLTQLEASGPQSTCLM